MKIEVHGSAGLVASASAEINDGTDQLHLHINTRERWAPHQLSGGRGIFNALVPEGCSPREHRLIAIESSTDENACAEVVFLPENENEKRLLHGSAFCQQEKDQLHYIVIPFPERPRALSRLREVATWRAR